MTQAAKGVPAKEHQRRAVEQLANNEGEAGAAKWLGLSRATVNRIIAGRGLYYATRELLNDRFGEEEAA